MGKILGPQGNTIKRLQEETGAKISVLGKGSMRDKSKVIFAHANIWCCAPVRRMPGAIKHLACACGDLQAAGPDAVSSARVNVKPKAKGVAVFAHVFQESPRYPHKPVIYQPDVFIKRCKETGYPFARFSIEFP